MSQVRSANSYTMRPWEWIAGVFAVGLLAAVLFPVYAGDHGPRASSNTLNGVRQLALGTIIYSADYHDFVPPFGHFSYTDPESGKKISGDQMAWKAALMPYLKNEEIFYTRNWPFLKQKGEQIELPRGRTNNASSFGYTDNLTAKVCGSQNGLFVLNIASPSQAVIEPYGSVDEVPMLEELAWTVDKWFGKKEIQRSSQKVGLRVIARLDGSFRLAQVQD